MDRFVGFVAAVVAAHVAGAGTVHLHFAASGGPYAGETNAWTVSAWFEGYDDATAYFGGFNGNILSSHPTDGFVTGFENLMSFEGTTPKVVGGDIFDVNIFNAALLSTNDPANPIDIFRFWTHNERLIRDPLFFDAEGLVSVFPDDGIFTLPDEFTQFEVTSDVIWWVPAPGGFTALGLGIAAVTHRRR